METHLDSVLVPLQAFSHLLRDAIEKPIITAESLRSPRVSYALVELRKKY